MANANTVPAAVVSLNERQWEGLGKVGEAALQVQNMLQMLRDVLNELPQAIDTDKLMETMQPYMEKLQGISESLQSFVKGNSDEEPLDRLRALINDAQQAELDKTLKEVLQLLGNLQRSGFFSSMAALSAELKCPIIGENPEEMIQKIHSSTATIQYWLESAKQGVSVVGNMVGQLDLPDRLDEIQEMADQWIQMAKRAQRLIQGDAPDLQTRLSGMLDMAEILGGQMNIAIGTLRDTMPEVLESANMGNALASIGSGGNRWMQVAMRVKHLTQGDGSVDMVSRVEGLLDQVEHLAGYAASAGFFVQAGKDGLGAVKGIISDLDLPDKLDDIAEEAEKWLKIAMRAKDLAQGDADSLADRVGSLLKVAETVGGSLQAAAKALEAKGIRLEEILTPRGDLNIAFGTGADFVAELWHDGTIQHIGSTISQGALIWMEIAQIGAKALKGDAESINHRIKGIVQGLHDAHLIDMLPEVFALVGNLQKAGLVGKINMVMSKVVPMIPSDEVFAGGVDKAVKALELTKTEMQNEANKGGGIFGLMKIVFAKDTQYLLKFFIRFATIFMKSLKAS
ncbi:hypothetical protein HF670_14505 [Acidithiobacillus thiooxidans]|jgi:uncharacterized protein YjgD (DUF1641 family)|uniref:Uncharacterized protein n=2 Tax=Acidithiobacillus thiooxidans TaxID=930 RepID=A0A1C2HXK5_ACITH|nr:MULTISPECIES: hypothetical protein [Acidithiobacillus]MBU2740409.1 hypothetical protein [Acidithiobacillus albertensis]MBU2810853.1 hypothetical protein [Acidithiobacillus thiooxidans]MBU2834532.1 hypothetical protein [Acidithiobacillus thiooxidans]MBU2840714.1 hypothetical protein [Acidithiobacillus thiooxidans]MBU2841211.1 hypothetical protein [Acidithiobacillus thiooxidans]